MGSAILGSSWSRPATVTGKAGDRLPMFNSVAAFCKTPVSNKLTRASERGIVCASTAKDCSYETLYRNPG